MALHGEGLPPRFDEPVLGGELKVTIELVDQVVGPIDRERALEVLDGLLWVRESID